MEAKISLDNVSIPSEDVVAKESEGELIILILAAGIRDMEDELFTLNETGRVIWDGLNGKRSLKDVAKELTAEFEAPAKEIEQDAIGFFKEPIKRSDC